MPTKAKSGANVQGSVVRSLVNCIQPAFSDISTLQLALSVPDWRFGDLGYVARGGHIWQGLSTCSAA